MLTETFHVTTAHPPTQPHKDATIFTHTLQPHVSLLTSYKKSQTPPHALALTRTHILTPQATKPLVHVYTRDPPRLEATIPFPTRITSCALTAADSVLILGTDAGQLLAWELHTGRIVTSPASHLRAVTCLTADATSAYVLSASAESSVLVWSVLDILSFASPSATEPLKPRHTLAGHAAAVTAVVMGHSAAAGNIAVSAAQDGTCIVWDYAEGRAVRTVLLRDEPGGLALDPADRAVYVGFRDGSVQCVDFFAEGGVRSGVRADAGPLVPPALSRWRAAVGDEGKDGVLCLALSYDGTMLLSGHEDGRVERWDVGAGRHQGRVVSYQGAPITNLVFERPTGWPGERESRRMGASVMKPRPHEAFSRVRAEEMGAGYVMSVAFGLEDDRQGKNEVDYPRSDVEKYLSTVGVLEDDFFTGMVELNELSGGSASRKQALSNGVKTHNKEDDMIMLEDGVEATEVDHLKQRVAALEESTKRMVSNATELRKDRDALRAREREHLAKRAKKENIRRKISDNEWSTMARRQQGLVTNIGQPARIDSAEDVLGPASEAMSEDGSTTSESLPHI